MIGLNGIHIASTFEIKRSVIESAIKLMDTNLLANLAGDMVAIEVKYQVKCSATLYK